MINISYKKSKMLNILIVLLFSINLIGCSSTKSTFSNETSQDKLVSVQITESTVINFPDKNLEKAIREEIQCPNGDILKDDVAKITTLQNTQAKHITNLSGLENLTNLAMLNLSNNQISNIEPLKGLINLTNLNLASNKMTNIEPLKNLTSLTHLNLAINQMANIDPLKGLTNLTNLNLASNKMTNIAPLKRLTNLTNLDLATNQMTNIEPLSGLTKLTNLDLATNQISNIESLKGLTNLTKLDLATNQMSNIEPLKKLPNLTNLNLATNQMTNIDSLKGLTNLTNLNLNANKIENYSPSSIYCRTPGKVDIVSNVIISKQMLISTSSRVLDITPTTLPDVNLEKLIKDTTQHTSEDILKDDVAKITALQSIQDNNATNLSELEIPIISNLGTTQIDYIKP